MQLFLEGLHPDIPIGPWTTPSGEAVTVVRVGLVEKSVMVDLYPEVLGMVGEEMTMVVYNVQTETSTQAGTTSATN